METRVAQGTRPLVVRVQILDPLEDLRHMVSADFARIVGVRSLAGEYRQRPNGSHPFVCPTSRDVIRDVVRDSALDLVKAFKSL